MSTVSMQYYAMWYQAMQYVVSIMRQECKNARKWSGDMRQKGSGDARKTSDADEWNEEKGKRSGEND